MIKPGEALARLRQKRPFVDHLVRMFQRYQADTGDRLAAAVTYYWFLSLFPILLIAVYFTRQALGDEAGLKITENLGPYLGNATAKAVGDVVQENAGKAGLIGLFGTLLTGLGWIQGLREAIRTVWHQNVTAGNIVTRKVVDALALVGLFAVIAASVFVSTAATAAKDSVLGTLELDGTTGAGFVTIALSYAVGFLVDIGIFLYLFVRLARVPTPLKQVFKGACFGAVGFEVVKAVGALYIARTTSKGEATYGTFAVVVGLLLFLNIVSRLVLYTAAFTVTGPYDDDIEPSGTASVSQARKSGIPQELAGTDLNVEEGGAPTPLNRALQDTEEDTAAVDRSWAPKRAEPVAPTEDEAPPVAESPPEPALDGRSEKAVVLAAKAVTAASAAVVVAVALYGGKTVIRIARR